MADKERIRNRPSETESQSEETDENEDERVCSECGGDLLTEGGELVCQECGLVAEEQNIDRGPEW